MFDKAVIDTDRFMDLPMSTKALYFLLGMEADDEGFVSYKKVMRIHGGNEDDVKLLTVKGFLISFPSGVVVITDWNKNNWLDTRRMRPTEYQNERKLIELTEGSKYVLSKRLASIEESSIEEKSIEEREESANQSLLTPKQEASQFFESPEFRETILASSKDKWPENEARDEFAKFVSYWTELNGTGKKQKWQLQKTFEVRRRLATWFANIRKNPKGKGIIGLEKYL